MRSTLRSVTWPLLLLMAGQARGERGPGNGKDSHRLVDAKGGRLSRGFVEGVVSAPLDQVFAVITDYDQYEDFMPRTERSRVLSRGNRSVRYQCKLDMPWPVSDVSYEVDVSWEPDRRSVRFAMVPGTGDGVRSFDGHWKLTELAGDAARTLVTYDILFEPQTRWPKWVLDIGTKATLGDILPSLRMRIRKLARRRTPQERERFVEADRRR